MVSWLLGLIFLWLLWIYWRGWNRHYRDRHGPFW